MTEVLGSSSSSSKADVSDLSLGSKRLRSRVVPPRPEAKSRKECKYTSKGNDRSGEDVISVFATDVLRSYNQELGTEYKLVEPGNMSHVRLAKCDLYHMDFTAKENDVADAPVEMFFAELKTTKDVCSVEFCTSMGPKNSISGDKNNGCCHCKSFNVQHPWGGGFAAGCSGLFTDEEKL